MTETQDFHYQGEELRIFSHAKNWKAYWVSQVAPYLKGDVLEVGAGVGTNTQLLRPLCKSRYVCLEPDSKMVAELEANLRNSGLSAETCVGTVESLRSDARFDTAIYIDVLEHIEHDSAELARVAKHIKPGGHVIVLSPAYQFLYSPFDKAIGHYRRYTRSSLLRCTPPGSSVLLMNYLDSLGGILSLGNRMLLHQSYPTVAQIVFWDRNVIPVSRIADVMIGFRVGKSILGVWRIAG